MRIIFLINFILGLNIFVFAQNDTINKRDVNNLKQGYWIKYDEYKNIDEEGIYVDDKKQGIWKKYYLGKKLKSQITYVNNRPDGYAKFYYENGNVSEEGVWKGNKWVGEYKYFHKNGNPAYVWSYNEKGKRTGVQKYFYENGSIMIQGEWKDGKESGVVKEYYADGSLKSIKTFENGALDVQTVKNYDQGTAKKEIHDPVIVKSPEENTIKKTDKNNIVDYSNLGLFSGEGYHKLYNKEKQLERDGEFHEGKLVNGKRFYYDAEGKLEKTAIYQNGKIVDLIYED